MVDEKEITATEAIALVLNPVYQALNRTMLLKPGEFNNQAVESLLKCHTKVALGIPGAQDKIIPEGQVPEGGLTKPVVTTAYINQIQQGQTIFAAPGEAPSSLDEVTTTNSFTK